jgi:ACR3 family arsenite transporter
MQNENAILAFAALAQDTRLEAFRMLVRHEPEGLPAGEIARKTRRHSYIAGLIILAAAPRTAMVFVWSNLTNGEPHFTLSQVALNDAIMFVAFAPIVGFLLVLSAITVPWDTLVLSVVLYIVVPVIVAQVLRRSVLARGGKAALAKLLHALGPVSLMALLTTLVMLFGFQGEQILAQPLIIPMLTVPILIRSISTRGSPTSSIESPARSIA